ncbi:helix-turn-helix domain-containing protein [Asticcacaulis benevestitus]|uniref:HTH cro/C1-type domain-containing protein n=1 Tax=Asticcacaulis benevestitus DSM 16100 = ATCC BAA-896 TaxID=1121022 RepID=V4PZY2_9CAUL|nr:helix-turn-helix transcriptional regulator [Asticcacaulis benevestitus]ESQ93956.1 hypothetical protein ABENE_04515 [Asticcacaulis benevestitus DSM 16100 = ATCC BAA-896]
MLSIALKSPNELLRDVANRAKARRLSQNLTQEGLAARADVSLGTLKLFEKEGKASFATIVRIAFALDAVSEFESLFPPFTYIHIEDVANPSVRQRGRRK